MCINDSEDPTESAGTTRLHVLDLPQIHTKPSFPSLLSTLSHLAITPPSWDTKPDSNLPTNPSPPINESGIPAYLTRIISSSLDWIPSPTDKERIWDLASKRLAERSGRTAMSALTRSFRIPTFSPFHDEGAPDAIDIEIHEPSLTGDNLGHKTWVASYLLAKRLGAIGRRLGQSSCQWIHYHPEHDKLEANPSQPESTVSPPNSPSYEDLRPCVLELGAGTGLVGLAASALFTATIHLTDLPSILPNLKKNLQTNASLATRSRSDVTAGILDWSSTHPKIALNQNYDIILAADSLYAPDHAKWLANTMNAYLQDKDGAGRIYVELPLREAHPPELAQFISEMSRWNFVLENGGEEVGYDDWAESFGDHEKVEVKCWWSVWKRFQRDGQGI